MKDEPVHYVEALRLIRKVGAEKTAIGRLLMTTTKQLENTEKKLARLAEMICSEGYVIEWDEEGWPDEIHPE